jgi:hypothetical protein
MSSATSNQLIRYDSAGQAAVMDWRTGEQLSLVSIPIDQLLEFRQLVKGELRDLQALIDEELISRLDKANRKHLRIGDTTLYTAGGETVKFDGRRLHHLLEGLVAEGVLDGQAAIEAVHIEPNFVVTTSAAKRLLNHPDHRVREAVEEATVITDVARSVRTRSSARA